MNKWALINEQNQVLNSNLTIDKIILSNKKEYDFKIIGEHNYHIQIIYMDFKAQRLYAKCEIEK